MWPDVGQTVRLDDQHLMISCMRVRPLSDGCHTPPDDLQAELREFATRRVETLPLLERAMPERMAFYSCHAKDAFGFESDHPQMADTEMEVLMRQVDTRLHDSMTWDELSFTNPT